MLRRKAIILAAGIGSRLRPLTDNYPKCMVVVNHESLIHRIIKQLNSFPNIDEIIVIAGYKSDLLTGHLRELGFHNVTVIENEVYDRTNNMYSLNLALNYSLTNSIVINADCIYNDVIVEFISNCEKSTILIDSLHKNIESMKVKVENDLIVDMSKSLDIQESFSSIDMYYFESSHLRQLKDIIVNYLSLGESNLWTEVAIRDFVKNYPGIIGFFDIKGLKWYEIDDLEDLKAANLMFK